MIAIIDYGMGNLRSVEKAFAHLGADVRTTDDPAFLKSAQKIVVPGVGAFDHAVRELKRKGLFGPIVEAVKGGKPYVGLCLGFQLLFRRSEEGKEEGFGLLEGDVRKFPAGHKVPHMGWNDVVFPAGGCPYWKGMPANPFFYFVHSYYAAPQETQAYLGKTSYGIEFASVIWKKNIFAVQFHPEKSQANGLRLLKNIVEN